MPWSTRFPEPIDGLASLRDAASYIQKLPKAEQAKTHWQDAAEHLIRAAEGSPGWLVFAEMFMLRAMHRGKPTVKEPRRKAVKVYRVVG